MENKPSLSNLLSRIGLLITAVSLLTFALGCFIINTHLSNYQIQDFDLVKPRAIIVGFTFIFLLAFNVAIYLIMPDRMLIAPIDVEGIERHNALKFIYVTLISFHLFEWEWATNKYCVFTFFGQQYDWRDNLLTAMFVMFILHAIFSNTKRKWIKLPLFYITIVFGLMLFLLYFNVSEFLLIFLLEVIIVLTVTQFQTSIGEALNEKVSAIEIDEDEDEEGAELEHPSEWKIKQLVDRFNTFYGNYLNIAHGLIGVMLFLFVAFLYSYNFYEKIPQSVGGGKLHPISYVADNDTIKGKKIYETENFVFIYLKDSTIKKLEWSEINKILQESN
jgi:hypothetical protein